MLLQLHCCVRPHPYSIDFRVRRCCRGRVANSKDLERGDMNRAWRGVGVAAGIAMGTAAVAGSTGTLVRAGDGRSAATSPGFSTLNSTSCPSTAVCEAVGQTGPNQGQNAPLAERWTKAGGWVTQTIPAPTGTQIVFSTQGISCGSASSCMAVGEAYNQTTGNADPFGEIWNGSSWKLAPALPYAAGPNDGNLRRLVF